MRALCVMTSDTAVGNIEHMGGAHINLIIRREGKPAAEHLKKRFETPYLLGRLYGIEGTACWIKEIAEVSGLMPNYEFIQAEKEKAKNQIAPAMPVFNHIIRSHPDEATISLGGHADVVKGIFMRVILPFSSRP